MHCLLSLGRFEYFGLHLFLEPIQDMGKVIYCRVSHSLFPNSVFISYVYANYFMLVQEDLWDALAVFAGGHDKP